MPFAILNGVRVIEDRDDTGLSHGAFGGGTIHIRVADVADLAGIVMCLDMAFATLNEFGDSKDSQVSDGLKLQITEGSIRVICDEMQVLGFISFWPAAEKMFIDTLAVLPTHHQRGLGSRLLASADAETLRLGLKAVCLFTKASMTDNLKFYQSRGNQETGRCDDDGFCRVFYSKVFRPVRNAAFMGLS